MKPRHILTSVAIAAAMAATSSVSAFADSSRSPDNNGGNVVVIEKEVEKPKQIIVEKEVEKPKQIIVEKEVEKPIVIEKEVPVVIEQPVKGGGNVDFDWSILTNILSGIGGLFGGMGSLFTGGGGGGGIGGFVNDCFSTVGNWGGGWGGGGWGGGGGDFCTTDYVCW